MTNREVTVVELAERMRADSIPLVLDVREHAELAIARIPGVLHIPLNELPGEIDSLDPTGDYVVMCHHGIRSAHAAALLRESGFERVANLVGGIDAWAREVDPTVERY